MPYPQHINITDPQYAPPVIRAPSPSSSIGSENGADETSLSDNELSPEDFERKCEQRLGLYMPRVEEELADSDPLLPQPQTAAEERLLHDQVMNSLRASVHRLEEDEHFEEVMLRGPQIAQQRQPSSDDLDVIMQSLMSTAPKSTSVGRAKSVGLGDTGKFAFPNPSEDLMMEDDADKSVTTAGKRSSRRKEKRKAV